MEAHFVPTSEVAFQAYFSAFAQSVRKFVQFFRLCAAYLHMFKLCVHVDIFHLWRGFATQRVPCIESLALGGSKESCCFHHIRGKCPTARIR